LPLRRWASALSALAIALALLAVPGAALAANSRDDADDRYANRLGELVNGYREEQGKAPLVVDRNLATLAREHSAAMAKAGRLTHDDFQSRFRRSGYAMCVENVGWNYPTPQAELVAWRRSPGHDRNLLDTRVGHMGIGAAANYVTFIGCR
jgi:uncharacterized protein YkwD